MNPGSPRLLFVYGTLKRGGSNHAHLKGRFVGEARTAPGYRLYEIEDYPGMVPLAQDRAGVTGELWAVDDSALAALDVFEGVSEGLYRRAPITLAPPHASRPVETYLYARPVIGCRDLGSTWPIQPEFG